jgi:hypothetical protein
VNKRNYFNLVMAVYYLILPSHFLNLLTSLSNIIFPNCLHVNLPYLYRLNSILLQSSPLAFLRNSSYIYITWTRANMFDTSEFDPSLGSRVEGPNYCYSNSIGAANSVSTGEGIDIDRANLNT